MKGGDAARLRYLSAFAFVLLYGQGAQGQQCSPRNPQYTGVIPRGTVNLVFNGQNPALTQGVAMWNDTCGSGVPNLVIRSTAQSGALNITVLFFPVRAVGCETANVCGCFQPDGQVGNLTGGTIRVGLDPACGGAGRNVAHELGHLLGLVDSTGSACVLSIMYGLAGPSTGVAPEDCAAVDDLWETPSETPPPTPDGDGEFEPTTPPPTEEGSPILIDLDRNFFRLTGLGNPVLFDIDADGEPEVLSWTSATGLDAFLWLDRNDNGAVDDGAELFGNFTPLIDGTTAENGYIPLAEFDLPALGGDGDGWIDSDDVIYGELRLWIDRNHNGISEYDEILSLADAGVRRIRLHYLTTPLRDGHGNYLRYLSRAWILVNGHERPTWTTDVFFVVAE